MELKPLYATGSVRVVPGVREVKLESKILKDPSSIMPSGIYKVIHWEKWRQRFVATITLIALITSIVMTALYATILPVSWVGFVLPIVVILVSAVKFIRTLIEMTWINRAVERYKEDLKIGLTSTPPFIARLYFLLHEKQISSNWATVFVVFYVGLLTLILWGLKDISWWIFDFHSWIKDVFSNPDAMVYLFSAVIIAAIVIQIVLTIQRKKRIYEIEAYFGESLASEADIYKMKTEKNKFFRRSFIISIMVLLIIPILTKSILRLVLKRRK